MRQNAQRVKATAAALEAAALTLDHIPKTRDEIQNARALRRKSVSVRVEPATDDFLKSNQDASKLVRARHANDPLNAKRVFDTRINDHKELHSQRKVENTLRNNLYIMDQREREKRDSGGFDYTKFELVRSGLKAKVEVDVQGHRAPKDSNEFLLRAGSFPSAAAQAEKSLDKIGHAKLRTSVGNEEMEIMRADVQESTTVVKIDAGYSDKSFSQIRAYAKIAYRNEPDALHAWAKENGDTKIEAEVKASLVQEQLGKKKKKKREHKEQKETAKNALPNSK